jgi:hypothetical protein
MDDMDFKLPGQVPVNRLAEHTNIDTIHASQFYDENKFYTAIGNLVVFQKPK